MMHARHAVLLALVPAVRAATYGAGHSSCACIDRSSGDHYITTNASSPAGVVWEEDFIYAAQEVNYGLEYGLLCAPHDELTQPWCDNVTAAAGWCYDPWCYVDQDTCALLYAYSTYKPGVRLAYSYATCKAGIGDTLTKQGTKNFLYILLIAFAPAIMSLVCVFGGDAVRRCMKDAAKEAEDAETTTKAKGRLGTVAGESQAEAVLRVADRLETARQADVRLALRVKSITISIAWVLIFLGLAPTLIFDFDIIKGEEVMPPSLGNRLYYRALFPPGLCMLVLSIRPADSTFIWGVTLIVGAVLLAACPFFVWLAAIWFGPEKPAEEFGVGRANSRFFNGGDSVLALSYALLSVATAVVSGYLFGPLAGCPICQKIVFKNLLPSRVMLLRLWRSVRILLIVFAVVFLIQDVRFAARNPRYYASSVFAAEALLCVSCALCAAVVNPIFRRKVISCLGTCAAESETRSLAAISTIIGHQRPKLAVADAAKKFRGIPFNKMTQNDWESNEDTGLNAHVVPIQPGQCHAFITHSWRDSGARKWEKLLEWRSEHEKSTGNANPTVWLDKACLNQQDIKGSLAGLPMYVAWSNELLLLASSSYVKRLWCIMELFTWVQMGCPIEGITVIDLDGGQSLDEDLNNFKVSKAACYMLFDKHRLLAVIENAFGDHPSFDMMVQDIVQARRQHSRKEGEGVVTVSKAVEARRASVAKNLRFMGESKGARPQSEDVTSVEV